MMLHFDYNKSTITLDKTNAHATFNLNIPEQNIEQLDKLSITQNRCYNFFGSPSELSTSELQAFLESLGETINLEFADKISELLKKIIEDVLKGFNETAAWVTLRASTPNPVFNTPRYHFDGLFFPKDTEKLQAKFLCTLKGPGTIFHPLLPDDREIFNSVFLEQCSHAMEYMTNGNKMLTDKAELAKLVWEADKRSGTHDLHMQPQEGGIFLVGDKDTAAIHSEPPISAPRLFFSIVPGSTVKIMGLKIKNRM